MKRLLALLLLLPSSFLTWPIPAWAQTSNTTPQPLSGLQDLLEVDIRLRGPVNAAGTFPTVKLIQGVKLTPWGANYFIFNWRCENTAGNCRPVTNVTVQVFKRTLVGRVNVTRFSTLCGDEWTTCILPPFPAVSAAPGQYYTFKYDRVKAQWAQPPVNSSTPLVAAPPPETGIVDNEGAKWTRLPPIEGPPSQIGVARNGVRVANAVDYMWLLHGVVWSKDLLSGAGCQRWSGAWIPVPCP